MTGKDTMFMMEVDPGDAIVIHHPTRFRLSMQKSTHLRFIFYFRRSMLRLCAPVMFMFSLVEETRIIKMVLSGMSMGIRFVRLIDSFAGAGCVSSLRKVLERRAPT